MGEGIPPRSLAYVAAVAGFIAALVWALVPLFALAQAPPPVQRLVAQPDPIAREPVRIAIIIDDLGYHQAAGLRAAALPGAVTLAVLPFSPHASGVAQAGQTSGKELILHVPMEPHNQVPWEAGGLSSNLSRAELQLALLKMLEAVPGAVGINNHMGSKFTEDATAMDWLAAELGRRQLFLVDSRTSPASRAWHSAQAAGVPSLKRDIFLDNEREPEAVKAQLQRLVAVARNRGYAVAIGHPHTATLDVLETSLPRLADEGIELVSVSRLLATTGQSTGAAEPAPGADAAHPQKLPHARERRPTLAPMN